MSLHFYIAVCYNHANQVHNQNGKEGWQMKTKQSISECQEKIAVPIDPEQFQQFIDKSGIFEKTKVCMHKYLKNWYEDDAGAFVDCMRADLDTVLSTYHFYDNNVSIAKDLERETDYINCWIRITDEEDDICCDYRTLYDYNLIPFDDTLS